MQSEGGHSEAEYVADLTKFAQPFALGFLSTSNLNASARRYAVGGVELWGDYYKAMDSFKIGPKTWEAFRHSLTCAKQAPSGGSVAQLESHAKPIIASDASDVVEMGERENNPYMLVCVRVV